MPEQGSSSEMAVTPSQPSLPWRTLSSITMGLTSSICRAFLFGLNKTETIGLERFLKVLDGRRDIGARKRGLITVSNHVCVLDDPLIWGVLPISYGFNPGNHRWSLGSYDICFKNKALCTFFSYGQVLPTHRAAHSPYGGLFQPTITQAIRLLSSKPFSSQCNESTPEHSSDISDPFTSASVNFPTYSTNGADTFPSPPFFSSRSFSWIHIFPEGRIHQHPLHTMRYFKWGISRLILESEPLPVIIPMFIDGNQNIMHESRQWPRWLPRAGNKVVVVFGDEVDGEDIFGELRERWRRLVVEDKKRGGEGSKELAMGELTDRLKYGDEAVALRIEVTRRVRQEVLKVRSKLNYPDEDPKRGLVETWVEEGEKGLGKMGDGSWVGDT